MIKRGLSIFLFVANLTLVAQAPILWDSLCCGSPDRKVDCLLGNDSQNSLHAIGDFIKLGAINSWGIARYNNNAWDSIKGGIGNSLFGNTPNCCAYHSDLAWYKNKLYIGDASIWHNRQQVGSLGVWDGLNWTPLPNNPFLNQTTNSNYDRPISSLNVIEDTLYIGGAFDSVGYNKINCITKFDGTNFYNLHFNNPVIGNWITCIEKYKNELYIGGNLLDSASAHINKNLFRIFRYDGTKWYSVGNGVRGGNAQVNSMVIYKGYLYVAGWFTKADGNAGNYIMKWDGNTWFPITNGIEGTNDEVLKLLVHNDKLYVFGSFTQAGDIPASRMAVYDGKQWCDLGGLTYGYVKTATFFKDTLYVGGNFGYIGNRYITYVAKRLAGDYHDTCGGIINTDTLNTNTETNYTFNVFPNPFTGNLTIQFPNNYPLSETKISITNTLGQLILTIYPTNYNQLLNISSLSSGMYYLTLEDNANKKIVKIIKE